MDLTTLFERKKKYRGLLGIEKVVFVYLFFTALAGLILQEHIADASSFFLGRAAVLAATGVLWLTYRSYACRFTFVLRVLLQLGLLSYWYPDTYALCSIFPYLDAGFASAEEWFFGFQPSIVFSQIVTSSFWSELLHLGYFSYFPMIATVVLFTLFCRYERFKSVTFIIVCSFLCYYLIYDFLPVAGPQYYFQAIGIERAQQSVFPVLSEGWFRTHTELMPTPGDSGFFRELVRSAHEAGERPTAAFPSSHVGISTILMILAGKLSRRLMWALAPFYVLLCLSTVYIRAHYAIDVLGGWVSALLIYYFSRYLYKQTFFHRPSKKCC